MKSAYPRTLAVASLSAFSVMFGVCLCARTHGLCAVSASGMFLSAFLLGRST